MINENKFNQDETLISAEPEKGPEAEVAEEKRELPPEFDLELIKATADKVRAAGNLKELIAAVRGVDVLVFANSKKLDGAQMANAMKRASNDIKSGKFELEEGSTYVTRMLGLRETFQRFMEDEMSKQEEQKQLIEKAESFDDLYKALEEVGEIPSQNSSLDSDKWITAIIDARKEIKAMGIDIVQYPQALFSITRTMGLRDKVAELIRKERDQ